MGVALHVVPVPAGEVGEGDGAVAVIHGEGTELCQAAPLGKVVHVHIQGQTILQAVYHTNIHKEVHTAVATYLLSHFTIFLDDGVAVVGTQGLHILLGHEGVGVQVLQIGGTVGALHVVALKHEALNGVLVGKATGTGKLEETVVRLGIHHVVLDLNHFTVLGTHQGGGVVTIAELGAGFAGLLLHVFLTVERAGIHSNEGLEAVTTVNVHHLSNRAEAVGGIHVATVLLVVLHAPAELLGVVSGVYPVLIPEGVQVVDVGTLGVDNLTKDTLLSHVEGVELKPVVAAVLQNHAVLAVFLGEVDELPALLQVHGTGHLNGGVLAVLQSALGHGEVVVPVCSNVYKVNIGAFADFLIPELAVVNIGRGKAGLTQVFLALFCALFVVVAQGYYFYTRNMGKTCNGTRATHAQANEGHAHGLHLGGSKVENMGLPLCTGRSFYNQSTLIPMSFGGRGQRLSLKTTQREEGRQSQGYYFVQFHIIDFV